METTIQELLDAFADLRERAHVGTAFGEPVTVAGRTIIPVAKIAYEIGLGTVQADTPADETTPHPPEESGGSGEMAVRPVAVVEVTEEAVRVQPIIDEQKVALAGTLLVAWIVGWLAYALIRIFPRRD